MTTNIEEHISITKLRNAIKRLPEDERRSRPGIWYLSQKQHWLKWLEEYNGPGAYNRKGWDRDAKFAYNHIVCPNMLLYLSKAIPLSEEIIQKAEEEYQTHSTEMAQSGAIRKVAPWSTIYKALWANHKRTLLDRILK